MLSFFRSVSYVPIIKWKAGERLALSTLRGPLRNQLVPLFLMPPAGDYDHNEERRLTPSEHIRLFGKRLYDAWGRSLVFVDAIGVDDEVHRQGLTVHPLTALLGRAHSARALACPATTLDRSPEYQEAVRRFVKHYPDRPICVRVSPLNMESSNFAADLLTLLRDLGQHQNRIMLVLDFASMGALKISEVEPFAELLEERIYNLPSPFGWLKIVVALTSFPIELKMKPNEVKLFPRTDWLTYNSLIKREPEFLEKVGFGDYAVDSAPFSKPVKGIIPSAHLRYTTPNDYLVVKGVRVKKPVGYGAIFPVADALATRNEYSGADFSDGDGFISRLYQRDPATTTGNASTWRWAGTDHHFARVYDDLRLLAGREQDERIKRHIGVQASFL